MNTVSTKPMYGWNTIPWKKTERNVFKLQKRIYQASSRGDVRSVRSLQRLMMKSRSARVLAVRKVTQDNQGKKTAGVDGIKSLNPSQRLRLSETLKIEQKAKPLRRVYIPKPGTDEQRPLGIPTLHDRVLQALVKSALEPEWEARFEANSYGFRPGRSCHDAIQALFNAIRSKPKYVLDADIEKCFDKICHEELLKKINTSPSIRRQIRAWLKAGVLDNGELYPTLEGTMQGGPLSPLLANIALHGLETLITSKFPPTKGRSAPKLVRYCDDFVVLHEDCEIIKQCKEVIEEWLEPMGLRLKPSKTRITHTLEINEAIAGFDFLGFNIRQFPVGKTKSGKNNRGELLGFKTIIKPSKRAIEKHLEKLREIVNKHKSREQEALIKNLNPVIKGWTNYYSAVASKYVFAKMRAVLFAMLYAWARRRHPKKGKKWITQRYWERNKGWIFQPPNDDLRLYYHDETRIKRHVKVKGRRSPYDGDWLYWSGRLGRHPEVSKRVATLLKKQKGRCQECGLCFKDGDRIELDHKIPLKLGGIDAIYNWQLLHRHCHDEKTARDREEQAV